MDRTVVVDDAAFEHEGYVQYSEAKVNAGVLATLAVVFGMFGFYFAYRVPDGIGFAAAYLGGFAAVYWVLIRTAKREWGRAKSQRRLAETRLKAAGLFSAVFAAIVIKTLEKILEEARDA